MEKPKIDKKKVSKLIETLMKELGIEEDEKVIIKNGALINIEVYKNNQKQIPLDENALTHFIEQLGEAMEKSEKCIFYKNFSSLFIEKLSNKHYSLSV
jgi:hypothetical protein